MITAIHNLTFYKSSVCDHFRAETCRLIQMIIWRIRSVRNRDNAYIAAKRIDFSWTWNENKKNERLDAKRAYLKFNCDGRMNKANKHGIFVSITAIALQFNELQGEKESFHEKTFISFFSFCIFFRSTVKLKEYINSAYKKCMKKHTAYIKNLKNSITKN